ncbi:PREDICTED: arrestin domain-containing protein F [Nicrophorus vespilloides]|uniref:Arrestin domain-containing protein F n=1 Tax=Nicrophorus vespilloides TaxID=110193 RepID=A0ABM1N8U7_NICVS|nr:PREDICTED: arrestin domain-containing protein F [Nicrophorus vespilloides]
MDIMEQLLCPQISMDVDDTPLDLGHSSCSNDDGKSVHDLNEDLTEDEKIKLLLQNDDFDVSQIPQTLTDHEESLKKTLFNVGPAVQFMKLHCTSCNIHLGSAPINQFNRFIHPLLHVLLCKGCYDFYTSGDFEKDEDGSELYCRWCGQGGKVMCCSDCAFVFCQKCVRGNLGKKTLDSIRDSDDWKCFVCNPKQLINLKLICNSLYHYIKDKIKIVKQGGSVDELKRDCTLCCNKPVSKGPIKRKRNNSETDVTFDINLEQNKKLKAKQVRNPVSAPWRMIAPALVPIKNQLKPNLNIPVKNTQNVVRSPAANNAAVLVMQNKKQISIKKPLTINAVSGNSLRIALPKQLSLPVTRTIRQVGPRTSHVYNFHPTSKVDKQQPWFEKATKLVGNITEKLSCQISLLSSEQKSAGTVEKLAVVHNKLQELLSTSVNSLIQVRKNLRNEFMDDLKKTKPNTTLKANQNEIILFNDQRNLHVTNNSLRVRPPASLMKIYRNNKIVKEVKQVEEKVIVEEDDDDDDVKLIEEEIETVEILDEDDDIEPIKPPDTIEIPIQDNLIIDAENNVELIEQVEIPVVREDDIQEGTDKVVENENNSEEHIEKDSEVQSEKETPNSDTEKNTQNEELPIGVENGENTNKSNENSLIESVDEPETVHLKMLNGSKEEGEEVSNVSSISKLAKRTDLSEKEIKRAMSVKVILSQSVRADLENNVEDSCENGTRECLKNLSQATEKEDCNESSQKYCQNNELIPGDNQAVCETNVNGRKIHTETSDDTMSSIDECCKENLQNRIDENNKEVQQNASSSISKESDADFLKDNASVGTENLSTESREEDKNCKNGLCNNVESEISLEAHCTTESAIEVIATT